MELIDIIDVLNGPVEVKTFMDRRVLFEGFVSEIPEDLYNRYIHLVFSSGDKLVILTRSYV